MHLHEQAFQASKLVNYAYDRMGRVEGVYFMGVDTVSLVDARVTTSHESCKVCVHRCVSIVCEHRECGKLVTHRCRRQINSVPGLYCLVVHFL